MHFDTIKCKKSLKIISAIKYQEIRHTHNNYNNYALWWIVQHCKRKRNGQHFVRPHTGCTVYSVWCVESCLCCYFACVAVGLLLLLLCDCCCVCVRFLACTCKSVHAHFLSKLLCASNSFSFAFEVLHLSRARSLAPPTLPTPPPTPPKPISRPAPFG